jgi:hypothetical protein
MFFLLSIGAMEIQNHLALGHLVVAPELCLIFRNADKTGRRRSPDSECMMDGKCLSVVSAREKDGLPKT